MSYFQNSGLRAQVKQLTKLLSAEKRRRAQLEIDIEQEKEKSELKYATDKAAASKRYETDLKVGDE